MFSSIILGGFYERAIRFWFELKGEWSKPIYDALAEIKERDKDYYAKLEVLYGNYELKRKVEVAEEIYNKFFES